MDSGCLKSNSASLYQHKKKVGINKGPFLQQEICFRFNTDKSSGRPWEDQGNIRLCRWPDLVRKTKLAYQMFSNSTKTTATFTHLSTFLGPLQACCSKANLKHQTKQALTQDDVTPYK